jgi:proton glutamate symport protein
MSESNSDGLTKKILIAMVLGLVVGLGLFYSGNSDLAFFIKPIGTVFIRLLKMVIIPLVASSIFMSMVNLGTPEELGTIGKRAIGYYFCTTAIAVFIGLIVVNLINPGVGVDLSIQQELTGKVAERVNSQQGLLKTVLGVLIDAIPTNPVEAMAKATVLQVIVFSIFFGIISLYHKAESAGVIAVMKSVEFISMKLTKLIMKLSPYGIFALMTDIIASTGVDSLLPLLKYMITVILGLSVHALILLLVGSSRLKKSPLFIIKGLSSAVLTAFSTASSAATLPMTMDCVKTNLGVKEKTAKFVLPLGATINMDGTALYESVAAIFIAQAYNISLTMGDQLIIFLTASLAAIGAAAIPGAGLVTMSIVLTAVGLPIEGIGLILAVDRILDMFRTSVNVFGDAVGTIFVDSFEDS